MRAPFASPTMTMMTILFLLGMAALPAAAQTAATSDETLEMMGAASEPTAMPVNPADTASAADTSGVPVNIDGTLPKPDDDEIRIQLTPAKQAMLSSRMDGKIAEIPVKDGDAVKKDDILVKFECTQKDQLLAQATARMDRQEKLLSSAQKLVTLGSGSKLDLNVRQAEAAEAKAALALAESDSAYCVIRAPFDGRVASLPVKAFQSVRENDLLVELIQDSDLEIEMMVPSSWLSWLDEGTAFPITIDETGKTYDAAISNIGGRVDPVTQTVKIYAALDGQKTELLAGMTGTAQFDDLKPGSNAAKAPAPAAAPANPAPPSATN